MLANGSRCELDGFAPLSALATEAPGADATGLTDSLAVRVGLPAQNATGLAKCSRRISIGFDLVNKGEPGCVSAGRLHHPATNTEIAI